MILISHNMDLLRGVADQIFILRLGQKVLEGFRLEVDGQRLASPITGTAMPQSI